MSLDYDSQEGRLTPSPIPEGTESVYGQYSNNPDAYAKHDDARVGDLYRRLREALTFNQRVELWREIERYLFVEQAPPVETCLRTSLRETKPHAATRRIVKVIA